MIPRKIGAGLLFGLVAVLGFQEEKAPQAEDKIGTKKAPGIISASASGLSRLRGYHCTLSVKVKQEQQKDATLEGVVLRDFAAFNGAYETYARGVKQVAKRSDGTWVFPEEIDGEEGAGYAAFRNPYLIFQDIASSAAGAEWIGDEAIDGVDCRMAKVGCSEKLTADQVQEVVKKIRRLKGFGNVTAYLDKKESSSVFTVWVGRSDLRIRKVVWELLPKGHPDKLPRHYKDAFDKLQINYDLKLSKFEEELDVKVPPEANAKLAR